VRLSAFWFDAFVANITELFRSLKKPSLAALTWKRSVRSFPGRPDAKITLRNGARIKRLGRPTIEEAYNRRVSVKNVRVAVLQASD
jgi:hypothetical protein